MEPGRKRFEEMTSVVLTAEQLKWLKDHLHDYLSRTVSCVGLDVLRVVENAPPTWLVEISH